MMIWDNWKAEDDNDDTDIDRDDWYETQDDNDETDTDNDDDNDKADIENEAEDDIRQMADIRQMMII